MSFKQIAITVTTVIVLGSILIYFISKSKSSIDNVTPETTTLPTPTTVVTMSTWQDEAGFTFQYPTGTTIDKHPEDTVNYANLTLTFPDKTTAQIIMTDKTSTNVATATFTDADVVVTVTGNKDLIVKSWQFIYPTPTASKVSKTTTIDDGGDVLEEE